MTTPTSNPVPSNNPNDLLFNAEQFDVALNSTAASYTDRLGVARRTVKGQFDAVDAELAEKLDDAQSQINVKVDEAAASAADAADSALEALGYLQTYRATSYGALASDPATDPLGNPPTVGDEYFNTTSNLLKRFNGTTWQASDINTANLAAPSGSSLVGYQPAGTGAVATTVQSKLRESVSVIDKGADQTGEVDSYAAFSAAPDNSFVPAGTYQLSSSVIGKTFYSFGDVTITGNGSANIVNLLDDFNGNFNAVEPGTYPSTSLEYKSEPSLVATSTGKVFCFYRIGPAHQGNTGETGYIVYRVYNKLTKSWGALQTIVNRAGWDSRNQIAGVTPTGRIIVAYYQCEYTGSGIINESTRVTKYKYSDDDGITWSSEFNLSQYCPYPSLDNVPFGKIISFADGRLLISLYNFRTIFTLKSTDNGSTWGTTSGSVPNPNLNITTVYTTPTISDDNITEPCLVKIDENNLVCLGRSYPTGVVADGTVTWKYFGRRWKSSTRYEVDMLASNSTGRFYKCTVAGTSGSTQPTHSSGTATDGTVTWEYIGAWAAWTSSTAWTAGIYTETYSEHLYRCQVSGTTGTSAPYYSKLEGNETQLAFMKSDNGGASWGSGNYVTWTATTYQASTSPPKAIVRGDTVDIMWFSRNTEFNLYWVRMQARAFFENPQWAFALADAEPRKRIMKAFVAKGSNPNGWRIDCGYVDMTYLPWSDKIMAAWYDKSPAQLGVAGKTTLYSTVIES